MKIRWKHINRAVSYGLGKTSAEEKVPRALLQLQTKSDKQPLRYSELRLVAVGAEDPYPP